VAQSPQRQAVKVTSARTSPKRTSGSRASGKRVRVLLNRSAGSRVPLGSQDPTVEDIAALLHHVGIDAEVVETGSIDEARALAGQAARGQAERLVVAGGDGTIGVVASELIGSETVLGILPLGSVMNIPRMLGLPRELEGAASILAHGTVRSIDVGFAGGRPFYETASVGMNAAVFSEASRLEKGERRSILRTMWVAVRYRPSRMRIELDDRVLRTRALTVTVSNGPYTGTGMTVAPHARLDDGRLDVTIFRRFSKFELARHFASIAFGRRRYAPKTSTYRSSRVRISSRHPLPARADSRDLGTTPVEFHVQRAALKVVVPPDGLPPEPPAAGAGASG
jgi:diacylglycerol kinase (ATP)